MGLAAELTTDLAALPTVTPTAKPALVPIPTGQLGPGKELDARRAPDGPSATVSVLRKLMADAGIQVLGPDDLGDPTATAWTEAGEIDQRGHELGLRVAHNIDDLVQRIARRVRETARRRLAEGHDRYRPWLAPASWRTPQERGSVTGGHGH